MRMTFFIYKNLSFSLQWCTLFNYFSILSHHPAVCIGQVFFSLPPHSLPNYDSFYAMVSPGIIHSAFKAIFTVTQATNEKLTFSGALFRWLKGRSMKAWRWEERKFHTANSFDHMQRVPASAVFGQRTVGIHVHTSMLRLLL